MYFDNSTEECVSEADYYVEEDGIKQVVESCPSSMYQKIMQINNKSVTKCVQTCPISDFIYGRKCVSSCHEHGMMVNDDRICVVSCEYVML